MSGRRHWRRLTAGAREPSLARMAIKSPPSVADPVPYCADCDSMRLALADGAETEAERERVLRDNPRVFARKRDLDGTPLCEKCLEYRRADRLVDGLEARQRDTAKPSKP